MRVLVSVSIVIVIFLSGILLGRYSQPIKRMEGFIPPDSSDRIVLVDYPDSTTVTKRKTMRLTIIRVTGGMDGTTEYEPIQETVNVHGVHDLVVRPNDWVISIGQRSYLLSKRD